MTTKKQISQVPGLGSVDEVLPSDMQFERKSAVSQQNFRLAQMSPSRRRAALRTKSFTADVNPQLYAAWDALRDRQELTVVRAFELSLLAFLEKHGEDFTL